MTEADNRRMPELINQFLIAASELYNPQHYGVLSVWPRSDIA